ncbi:MAG: hypothetical protein QM627_10740 [Luteolibacter sp.]
MKKSLLVIAMLCLAAFAAWKFWPRPPQAQQPPLATKSRERELRVADSQLALTERLKAAREISTDLTNDELKRLLAFLAKPIDARTGEEDFMAINEVMNQLRKSGMACGEYANALCGLIREPQTHPVVRDYAIQHAGSWIKDSAAGTLPVSIGDEDRKKLLDCIVVFLQEPDSVRETGFGTTLNVLQHLQVPHPREIGEIFAQMSPRLLDIVEGREGVPMSNRMSVIQSLPFLPDREEARQRVRDILSQAGASSPFRLVAIGTLGQLGDSSDVATLRQIRDSDTRLQYAATAALKKLETSLHP